MVTLAEGSLDWALDHAVYVGDTDVFPAPFEYAAIRHDWSRVRAVLLGIDLDTWRVRTHRRILAPKARYGFRVVTQLDPLDFLLFAAAVYEIAPGLESGRVPRTENTIYSYRVQIGSNGQLFDPTVGYGTFQRDTQSLIKNDPAVTHVVVTDIADFYSRIYLHRLENALTATGVNQDSIRAVMKLLDGWNGTETYGIPVGSAPARILAETALIDVDEALLARRIRFKRFNDDYRIFCTSQSEAYRSLTVLADVLFRSHGLTLQVQKTTILERAVFAKRFFQSEEQRELSRLEDELTRLVSEIGLDDPYGDIDYADLTPEQRAKVDQLNLAELLVEQLKGPAEPDLPTVRFILRRMGQLGDGSLADTLLDNIEVLHPALPEIVQYFKRVAEKLSGQERARLALRLLDLLTTSSVAGSEFHRLWILELFASSVEWNNKDRLFPLLGDATDQASRRKLLLAIGRAGQRHWFQSQWRDVFNEPPWPRRAAIAAASCLPADARKHWYKSIKNRLDDLELAVANWAQKHPFA